MYELLNIPAHKNCTNCGACCGIIPANSEEIQAIGTYLDKHPDVRKLAVRQCGNLVNCPFRDSKHSRCAIYQVRPMICRLMGVTEGMLCKNGNTAAINGTVFLTSRYSSDEVTLLNLMDWSIDGASEILHDFRKEREA